MQVENIKEIGDRIKQNISQYLCGQQEMLEMILAGLLANGHVLIEGVPGIAKTLTAKLISKSINAVFSRIQFTPDLMPSDITGTSVFKLNKSEFEFNKGPIFSNIILIDEINRSPAKTQAALFEVMEERQVTVDGVTYSMSLPFLVIATQNPIEHEGTYRLPEAQTDRFIIKITSTYPSQNEEIQLLERFHNSAQPQIGTDILPVVSKDEILYCQQLVRNIHIENKLMDFIVSLVQKTRLHNAIYLGASPRASISLMLMSKAWAALQGRNFVTPEDIKTMFFPVLNHRIILTPEKEMEGISIKQILNQISESIEIPR